MAVWRRNMKYAFYGAALTAAIALSAGPTVAKELIYGSWMGANASTNAITLPTFFDRVREATDGSIDWTLVPGGQLASGPGTVDAVKGNLIDGGTTMAPYTPRELPATNAIFTRTVAGNDVIGTAGAMNELMLLNCPECQAEYKRNNAVAFGGYNTTPYLLMCKPEIASVADLNGTKVRASGGGVEIMKIAGATPVAMSPAEATSALERGVVDCVMGSLAWLRNYGYMDITKHVVEFPLGMAGPPILMYLNRDVWEGMTDLERQAHIDNAAALVAVGTITAQLDVDAEVKATALEAGIVFHEGGADFAAVMDQRVQEQEAKIIEVATAAGVDDIAALLAKYTELLAKWNLLSKDIGMDVDKFTEVLNAEVYSKIDPNAL
jgi:TRAP-type C4-dicarboxylate transport system substrate-binding protein